METRNANKHEPSTSPDHHPTKPSLSPSRKPRHKASFPYRCTISVITMPPQQTPHMSAEKYLPPKPPPPPTPDPDEILPAPLEPPSSHPHRAHASRSAPITPSPSVEKFIHPHHASGSTSKLLHPHSASASRITLSASASRATLHPLSYTDPYAPPPRSRRWFPEIDEHVLALSVTITLALLVAIGVPLGAILPQKYVKQLPVNILVPFYVYPDPGAWDGLYEA